MEMDAQVFERGFNHCDLDAIQSAISDDLEFYHDQGGVQDRAAFMAAFTQNICGGGETKPIRRLVADTNRVFPLYGEGELYGAIQQGDHNFYNRGHDGVEVLSGSAAFTTLWMLDAGEWRMRRVLSFDHSEADETAGYRSPLFDNDRHLEAAMALLDIPSMALARIEGGRLQQVRVLGELVEGRAAPVDAIYNIASLTKPVTAMLTLKLVDAGLWDLDEPLRDYYVDPDIADAPELARLTTRHVLTHRTGFPNWRYLAADGVLRFEFEPGSRQQYSGEGMEYLRHALEARFDRPIEDLAHEYLFEPLGMNDTHFIWSEAVSEERYAIPHDTEGQPLEIERHTEANAADNLLTTAGDYGRFLAYVIGGAGLSGDLWLQTITPATDRPEGVPFGLGWQVIQNLPGDGYALQHTGADTGVRSIAILYPETGQGILALSNSENMGLLWPKLIAESFEPAGAEVLRRNLANQ